ncbi:MAG: HPF/RaiA family ribosome-associated protein [Bacteroides sp.]|nr:MAG: HPF/RaiA family ribosome-associated protein [Bacteroides sp.]
MNLIIKNINFEKSDCLVNNINNKIKKISFLCRNIIYCVISMKIDKRYNHHFNTVSIKAFTSSNIFFVKKNYHNLYYGINKSLNSLKKQIQKYKNL